MTETLIDTFRRYRDLIKAALPTEYRPAPRDAAWDRLVYQPLLTYYRLLDFKKQYETLSRQEFGERGEELREECEKLEIRSDYGKLSAVSVWSALALHVAGTIFIRDAWTDLASDAFGRLSRGQDASGRFLPVTASTHPEAGWYDELATLHAAASYAVQAEDRTVARTVAKSAEFISREIEPNHATGEPWALFAFIWNWSTRPMADQVLHAVTLRQGSLDAVSLILLEDALYCLELFLEV